MKRKKTLYPGTAEAKNERKRSEKAHKARQNNEPDFIGNCPNYDKFPKWDAEKVLVWLNID